MHRVSGFAGMLESSPKSHSSMYISDSDGDEQLLEMELRRLRQRRKGRCQTSAVTNSRHITGECMQVGDDKVHDSSRNEFCEEKRNFRNCPKFVTRNDESVTTGSDSESDSVLPVFSTSLTPQCADCEEPAKLTAMSWTCDRCTFSNFARSVACEMCDTVRTSLREEQCVETEDRHQHVTCRSPSRLPAEVPLDVESPILTSQADDTGILSIRQSSEWACERCTYLNAADYSTCEVCRAAMPSIKRKEKTQPDSSKMEEKCQGETLLDPSRKEGSCKGRASSSTLKAYSGKESLVVVDLLDIESETKDEQQQETEQSDPEISEPDQTGCGGGQMEALELVSSGSETEDNEQDGTQKDTVSVGTDCEEQTCSTGSDVSRNKMPLVVELVDTESEMENELDSEADCVPATPDRSECDAGEIRVIAETPPRERHRLLEKEVQTTESGNSHCSMDIDEFLSDDCEEKCAGKVDELNTPFPSSSADTVMSEAGWDGCLLEDIIGNDPDEWETESLATVCAATGGKTTVSYEAHSSSVTTPRKVCVC